MNLEGAALLWQGRDISYTYKIEEPDDPLHDGLDKGFLVKMAVMATVTTTAITTSITRGFKWSAKKYCW